MLVSFSTATNTTARQNTIPERNPSNSTAPTPITPHRLSHVVTMLSNSSPMVLVGLYQNTSAYINKDCSGQITVYQLIQYLAIIYLH